MRHFVGHELQHGLHLFEYLELFGLGVFVLHVPNHHQMSGITLRPDIPSCKVKPATDPGLLSNLYSLDMTSFSLASWFVLALLLVLVLLLLVLPILLLVLVLPLLVLPLPLSLLLLFVLVLPLLLLLMLVLRWFLLVRVLALMLRWFLLVLSLVCILLLVLMVLLASVSDRWPAPVR